MSDTIAIDDGTSAERDAGAGELRVNARADNTRTSRLYGLAGFAPYIVTHRKLLREG